MLTSKGFKRKKYPEILEEMIVQARELWGENIDTSHNSPLGKFIRLQAYKKAEDAEVAEEVYNSRFVDTSEGVSLEQNVKHVISKKQWKKAFDKVTMNLDRGVVVPAGTLVGTKYGVLFATDNEIHATDASNYTMQVTALEYGNIGNAAANEITEIINPIVGLNSVNNPEPFRNGQDEESDPELQDRYYQSLGKIGNRRVESIRASVLDEVEGVRSVIVEENDTMVINANGVPPKSFHTIVFGGNAPEIAQKIFESKAGGIQAFGQEIVEVKDSQGALHKIGFTYASTLQIFIKAQIKKGSNYPLHGDELVKEQIVKYIGGTYNTEKLKGLGMSDDVVLARLESRLFAVEGVEDVKVSLSADGFIYLDANVEIGFAQVAETDVAKIEVSALVT